MIISQKWLQTYFKDQLPEAEKIAHLLTFHVFEIEDMKKAQTAEGVADTVFDVKVLPDRAHYALSHRGLAYELSAITGMPTIEKGFRKDFSNLVNVEANFDKTVHVNNEESELCLRYMARSVEGVNVTDSPQWLVDYLAAVGQRSINNIVDAANFVMLDTGQPLHTFDADLLEGGITIRKARPGEKITTLDGKEVMLDESILVIADDKGPLVIAGVKGGNRAGVTEKTKNIVIESANFNAGMVRKTTQKVGIRTDSSKRYENEITPELTIVGMEEVTALIEQIHRETSDGSGTKAGELQIGPVTDVYPHPQAPITLSMSPDYITERIGVEISRGDIKAILEKLHIVVAGESSGDFTLIIPPYRLDLVEKHDIVEEVGRLYGYDKIPVKDISTQQSSFAPSVVKQQYFTNYVRSFLIDRGFSEVYTYSLTDSKHGEVALLNPMASDKNMMRVSLDDGLAKALELNTRNAALLGLDEIKIFELGTVFSKTGEYMQLGLGISIAKSMKNKDGAIKKMLEEVRDELLSDLGSSFEGQFAGSDKYIINFTELINELLAPKEYPKYIRAGETVKFRSISPYPFIVRDIAVFTPAGTTQEVVESVITDNAGELRVRHSLFDMFEKTMPDGVKKVSYGFRIVFQSHERTLTDDEVNAIITTITDKMNAQEGWQVR